MERSLNTFLCCSMPFASLLPSAIALTVCWTYYIWNVQCINKKQGILSGTPHTGGSGGTGWNLLSLPKYNRSPEICMESMAGNHWFNGTSPHIVPLHIFCRKIDCKNIFKQFLKHRKIISSLPASSLLHPLQASDAEFGNIILFQIKPETQLWIYIFLKLLSPAKERGLGREKGGNGKQ